MTGTQPIANAREGALSVAIFDGTYGKNAVLQKSYLKKGGDPKNKDDWQRSSINLFLNELPKVKKVVDEMCEQFADEIKADQEAKPSTE